MLNQQAKKLIQEAIDVLSVASISQSAIDNATNLIKTACESIKNTHFTFDNIEQLKKADLNVGDIVETKGYYNKNDKGNARYIIMSYEEWYDTLPEDIKAVSYRYDKSGFNAPVFYKTPVDEYGNHTLDNGLVAKLINNDEIKVEQWGCIGDGKFNNSEPLIHLFAFIKSGNIKFEKDKTYLIGSRQYNRAYFNYSKYCLDNNLENVKELCILNEYIPLMVGNIVGGAAQGKPVMANIDGVVLDGDGCTIKIDNNNFCEQTSDFGIFEFAGSIRNLEIKNFNFDGNGLSLKKEGTRTTNHTLVYLPGGSIEYNGDAGAEEKTLSSLGININKFINRKNEFSNINIHHNTFNNSGTAIETNDQGGDFILIINPEISHDVYIEDNYFKNWGRWVFSVDLGGNGERFNNYRFNRNRCVIDEENFFITKTGEKKYRGLGWIDFEANKCWTNLEVKNNYINGLPCFAINGAGKISENVTISGNEIIRNELNYYSAYQYMFYFYGVEMKNLVFENNIERGNCPSNFGYTLNNVTIKNNDLRNYIDLSGVYGDMIIDSNKKENGDLGLIINITGLSLPSYVNSNDELYCKFQFVNNNGGLQGAFYNPSELGTYKFIKLIIENNNTNIMNIRVFDTKEFIFDETQVTKDGLDNYSSQNHSWSVRGAKFTSDIETKKENWTNDGGYIFEVGNIFIDDNNEKLICVKSGYYPIKGAWGFADPDRKFNCNDIAYKTENYFYTDNYLYVSLNEGTLGDEVPTHTSGISLSGNVKLLYLCDLAKFEKIN